MAFLVSLSVGFPEIYFFYDMGEKYNGAPLMGTDAEEHYLAAMREAYDGRYILSNVYSIPKDIPFLYPEGGEMAVGFLSRITGLGVVHFNVLMKFLSPFILFLLIYHLARIISGRRSVAIISATFVLLGSNLAARPNEILSIFGLGHGYHPGFNNYFRPINPQVSSIFFFGYLTMFYSFLRKPNLKRSIFLGLVLGAAFYFYLFTWTFLLVFTGLFFIFVVVSKKYQLAKKILLTTVIGLTISIPYWFEFLRAISSSAYTEAALRFGLQVNNRLFLSGSLVLVLTVTILMFAIYFWKFKHSKDENKFIFGALFGLSILVVYNQQVITGQSIQSSHYHFMSTIPMLIVFAVCLGWHYVQKVSLLRNNFAKILIVAFVATILLVNNFNWQMFSYRHVRQTAYERQEYMPAIKWAKENIPESNIIFADTTMASLIPVFTPLNIYPSGFAQYYLLPADTFKNFSFLGVRFSGVKPEEAKEKFLGELKDRLSYEIYGIRYRKNMPDEVALGLAEEYTVFYKQDLGKILKEDYYKPDYLIFDQKFNELALPESGTEDFMDRVAFLGDRFLVYKLK